MSGDVHVRFCEGVGVQFLRATHLFIERLWRNVKYEEVYLKAYGSISEARRELREYFELYNQRRRHQGLDYRTPDEVYFATLKQLPTAV